MVGAAIALEDRIEPINGSIARAYQRMPDEYRQQLEAQGYGQESILKTYHRHKQLGWLAQMDFVDTPKPNAVIIHPAKDENGAFQHSTNTAFLKRLHQHYDVLFRIASHEGEAYRALESVSDIELIIIGGHGAPGALSLGEDEERIHAPSCEERVLTPQDTELASYLQNATKNAIIFLDSCDSKQMVDFVKRMAGDRTVIGATERFSNDQVEVLSVYPFDIRIKEERKLPLLPIHYVLDRTYTR